MKTVLALIFLVLSSCKGHNSISDGEAVYLDPVTGQMKKCSEWVPPPGNYLPGAEPLSPCSSPNYGPSLP